MSVTNTRNTPSINLIDEAFDPKKSNTYHLSILADENSFSFCVLDTDTNKYLVLNSQQTAFQEYETLKKLGNNFKSVTCAVAHNKFSIVPSALFDEENKESLLNFSCTAENEEKIHSDHLHTLEAKNIFTISKVLESAMRKCFINTHFMHHSTSFIEGLLIQNKNAKKKTVFANFRSSYFEIAILDEGNLVFNNAFKYKTPDDIAYYILFVYEQLHLNPEEIELIVSGEIEKTAKEHSLLYNYIRHVKFASLPEEFTYSYKFNEIQSHNFFSLFTQYLVAN